MKIKLISAVLASLLASSVTFAKPPEQSTTGSANAGKFTQTFSFTTSSTYNPALEQLYVSGLTSSFSSLSLDVFANGNTSGAISATTAAGNLTATFMDKKYAWNLAPSTTYTAIVSGTAKSKGSQFTLDGTYLASIAAVPEPETYAMMLAGLGLLGFVARGKKKAQATA